MNTEMIIIPVIIFASLGLVSGILLAVASKLFAVKTDERIPMITDALPGANCGGCGFSGCGALAESIVKGEAKCNACSVGGDAVAAKIAGIMGTDAEKTVKKRAFIACSADSTIAKKQCDYEGAYDCLAASVTGGEGACRYRCLGYGSCAKACVYGAISVGNGVAAIDSEKCVGCGACVEKCPRKLIRLLPADRSVFTVGCSSRDRGADASKACGISCIGCGICAKVCTSQAISVISNLAVIDPEKCTGCGTCAEKCPRHIFIRV